MVQCGGAAPRMRSTAPASGAGHGRLPKMYTLPVDTRRRRLCLGLLGASLSPAALAQAGAEPTPAEAALTVTLADGMSRVFTLAELQVLPVEEAVAQRRDGTRYTVRGVSVTHLLRLTGLDLARNLGVQTVVGSALVARARDGYRSVFGLAVADPRYGYPPLLVSWTRDDGRPLAPESGPLQLLFTGETRTARWVRQLAALEVKAL